MTEFKSLYGKRIGVSTSSDGATLQVHNSPNVILSRDDFAAFVAALYGEPVTVIRDSEFPEVKPLAGNQTPHAVEYGRTVNGHYWLLETEYSDGLRRDALERLALARHIEAREAERDRVKAEDARRAPWRKWLDERIETNDVSWVAIDDVAGVLAAAGVTPPVTP